MNRPGRSVSNFYPLDDAVKRIIHSLAISNVHTSLERIQSEFFKVREYIIGIQSRHTLVHVGPFPMIQRNFKRFKLCLIIKG